MNDRTVDDPWQARLDRMRRFLPVPLLAVSTVASFAVPGDPSARVRLEAVFVAAAAIWSVAVTARLRPGTPTTKHVLAYAVHSVLAGVLVGIDLTFGIFAYSGFLFAYPLGKRWRTAGFGVSALIVSASLSGGYPTGLNGQSLTYLVVAAVLLGLVFNAASITNRALEQNEERGRVIDQLAEANRRLELSMAENAQLHARLLVQARDTGVVEERQRLAGEIHDTLAQGLTGIIAQLAAAEHVRHDPGQLSRHLELAASLARANLTEARRSVRALRPGQLEGVDLPEAIGVLAREWSDRSGVAAGVETTGTPVRAAAGVEDILFRVAQEALSNVAKHADATQVAVTLTYLEDALLLDVHDDGSGFDPEATTDGYGLVGMRERLARIGGTLTIESGAGYGTTLNAAVPL
ncbi:sensor histidine kinase [Amycolatopsis acidiphila]|uniref:Sensor histidine kinase n=1 Tax=Amycolatopsis acidiphila TaxID=715473 RepID=A0A558A452_9PSEU|nr:sensor histidine kinase [Amycolatopsis acidiphila]TVT19039.1 sensor histidine kinase [Amycolatopsis acidiphila]UIJ63720.1 sensor histidine kinase [Amycolatopsis acidiphila]GHG67238.1 histidine kinase [Amycolatopsis acidiphila]